MATVAIHTGQETVYVIKDMIKTKMKTTNIKSIFYTLALVALCFLAAGQIYATPYANNTTIISTNLLSGTSGSITSFVYNLSLKPTGTTATVQFSRDGTIWKNSAGAVGGTNTLNTGTDNTISLTGLGWFGAGFYYKVAFTGDGTATPVLDDVKVTYLPQSSSYASGTQATYIPQTAFTAGTTYYWRSYAKDLGGTNTWSSTQPSPFSFSTVAGTYGCGTKTQNDDIIITTNCAFPGVTDLDDPTKTVDGTDGGNIRVATGAQLTINANQRINWGIGKSLIIEEDAQININETGSLVKGHLYVTGTAGDTYVATPSAMYLRPQNATPPSNAIIWSTAHICSTGFTTRYTDADGDGYGTGTSFQACPDNPAYAANNTDCNNGSANVFTSHAQCYTDADGDVFTNGLAANTTCLNTASCATATKASASTDGATVTTYTAGTLQNSASSPSDANDAQACPAGSNPAGSCNKCNNGAIAYQTSADNDPWEECASFNCTSKVYDWSGNNCIAAVATANDGDCNGSGACTSFADSCTTPPGEPTILASCGSAGCKQTSVCVQGTASTTSDTVAEICYTSAQHSCSSGYVCNATGTCTSLVSLNSASGLSCTTKCSNIGVTCASVGTDTAGTNNTYIRSKYNTFTEDFTCFSGAANCSTTMTADGNSAGCAPASMWTYCKCQ